jgi:hypothetical protein
MEFAQYITGFTDGEGTFSVSFSQCKKLNTGVEARPSFSISQHNRSKDVLFKIRDFFGVGGIRFCKRDQNYKYEVRAIKDLRKIIIPHFKKYPLMTKKREDFEKFVEICEMVSKNLHLNSRYIREIINIAYSMNESGKRKYSKEKLLSLVIR